MVYREIPKTTLPAKSISGDDRIFVETFSDAFSTKLNNGLLKEIGAAYINATEGRVYSTLKTQNSRLNSFCTFLSREHTDLSSLADLTPEILLSFVEYLQRELPTKHTAKKTTHPWHSHWKSVRTVLRQAVNPAIIPYVPNQNSNSFEGHTPYAMGMLLDVCRIEIDRIRTKFFYTDTGEFRLKWDEVAVRGKPVDHEWIDKMTVGSRSKFTENQLDYLESVFFDKAATQREAANKLQVSEATIKSAARRWKSAGRKKGRPNPKFTDDDINLTIKDVIATIHKFIPNWPTIGRVGGKSHRVYETPHGVLKAEFDNEAAAKTYAQKNDWHYAPPRRGNKHTDEFDNPAERLINYRGQAKKSTPRRLARKMYKLIPDGTVALAEQYFPTTYDMTVILLYWLAVTGWNLEAIRFVRRLDVYRQIKTTGPYEILSVENATFVVEIVEEPTGAMLTGQKKRGQPENKPKLYTHISDRNEPYGLFRVLEDYYWLTERFIKNLGPEAANCILIGFNPRDGKMTYLHPDSDKCSKPYQYQIKKIFRNNEIFEDESHKQRILNTSTKDLRTTYITTLRYLDVPITTLVFLTGHESHDTYLVHYSSGQHGTKITRERSRKLLNTLEHKVFAGEILPYSQVRRDTSPKVLQIFTHRDNDFVACHDRHNPSWPENEQYFPRNEKGKTIKHCDRFDLCLLCKQCIVTEESLPHLVRWRSDIREWRRQKGGANFPHFMNRLYQAIGEVFDLCEVSEGTFWKESLHRAQERAMEDDFDSPPLGRGI